MPALLTRLRRTFPLLLPVTAPPPDPFHTLELQIRLTRLSREIGSLNVDKSREFAAGHHSRAATIAYELTLADACRLVGVPVDDPHGPAQRLLCEANLFRAGWVW